MWPWHSPEKIMPGSTDVFHCTILVVDDEECNVRLLEFALRRGGYVAVSSTTNPLEVCALQLQNHYDLVILDLQMPRMSGFAVLEGLRNGPGEKAAVLVLSADPAKEVRAREAGAAAFLSKPFLLAEVLRQVQLLLEKRAPPEIEEPAPLVAAIPVAFPRPRVIW